jgi:hypothetical protein
VREIIIPLSFILLSLSTLAAPSKKLTHLESLRTKYPYGLIGDDFGILNETDLAINTCNMLPEAITSKADEYPRWQCFETSLALFDCEDEDYDTDEKSEMAILGIDIHTDNTDHSYNARRAIPMKGCKLHKREWEKLTKNEKYFCISGPHWSEKKETSGKTETVWGFDKFKTRKGCDSFFEGDCSLQYQLKQGCKPISRK